MKIFLETANADAVRLTAEWGALEGVATTPALVAREKKDYRYVLREITRTFGGPVLASVVARHENDLAREARELTRISDNVVVRLPPTLEGLQCAAELEKEGRPVDITHVFSPAQALFAARAGATYVSTTVSRLEEAGIVAMDLVRDSLAIFDNYGFETQFVVGGLVGANHVIEAALAGTDVAAIPLEVLQGLFAHPLTDSVFGRDRAEWEEAAKELPIKRVIRGDKGS